MTSKFQTGAEMTNTEVSDVETVSLRSVRRMLEGVVPGVLCTTAPDGTPHVCFLSQADYVDENHVALSFQFFNRTRANILATRRACLSVDDPQTAGNVRMYLEYLRTEERGSTFERMNAKLAGIASHSGMQDVFKLAGADIYRVVRVERVKTDRELEAPLPRCDLQPAVRLVSEALAGCSTTEQVLDTAVTGLRDHLQISHAMVMMLDVERERLYTVASFGYASSGLGSEIALGEGVAGIAAREGVPIRVGHLTVWQTYSRAIRDRADSIGLDSLGSADIPPPGLASPHSQLAVPMKAFGQTVGVLFMESENEQFFSYDDEDAIAIVGAQVASQLRLLQTREAPAEQASVRINEDKLSGKPLLVRHYPHNDSIFIENDYLIKGVAGAIFRKLVADHLAEGRTEFTNRELRLDPSLRLPGVADNLEVRLVLLQRRLDEHKSAVHIEKTGRGRFRMVLDRPLRLETVRAQA